MTRTSIPARASPTRTVTGVLVVENSSPFSTSSSRMRSAATRLRVASMGGPGLSIRTRGESRGDLLRDVDHVRVLGEPRLHHTLEPGDQPGEPLRAHHEGASISSCWSGVPVPFDSVWAMPRITVTGVRSSCPSRLTSSWRRAARSRSASWASSSWRERRRSRSRASVSSPITRGVTCGGDHAAARGRLADRVEDLVAVGVLQHVAGGARDQHLPDRLLIVDPGQGDDAHVGERRLQQAGGLDPVHLRHADVHQDDVGLRGAHEAHGVGAARGSADNEELLGSEQRGQGFPEPRIVIDNGNPDLGTGRRSNGEGVDRHLWKCRHPGGLGGIPRLPGSLGGTADPVS